MFYTFHQNNSGGSFDFDEDKGITHHVIIEASNSEHANKIALNIGLYFDGSGDCPCCGNRWCEADDYEAAEQPEVYGEHPSECDFISKWMDPGMEICVHYLDGKKAWYG